MATVVDTPIYTKSLQGGDVFVLTQTDKTIVSIVNTKDEKISVIMQTDKYWQKDNAKTRDATKEYKHNLDDWNGKL